MSKLIGNICKNPGEPKFKIIKKQNATIKAKLFSLHPEEKLHELIECLGYVLNHEDDTYVFVGDYYTVLKRGQAFIEVLLEKLRLQKPYTEEDRIRMQKVKEDRE